MKQEETNIEASVAQANDRPKDFKTIMRGMLMENAVDANGEQVQIDGHDATYMEVLCKQILQKSFKDANLGWRVLVHAGVIPEEEKESFADFFKS